MPNYKTHLVGGAVSFVLVYKLAALCAPSHQISIIPAVGGLGLTLLGSIFPDIDIPSRMQTLFYQVMALVLLVTLLFQFWKLFLSACALSCIIFLLRHRTITHRPWFLLLFPLAILGYFLKISSVSLHLGLFLYSCFVIGALSHILLDFGIKKLFRRGF